MAKESAAIRGDRVKDLDSFMVDFEAQSMVEGRLNRKSKRVTLFDYPNTEDARRIRFRNSLMELHGLKDIKAYIK